jgi:hypothetical protein
VLIALIFVRECDQTRRRESCVFLPDDHLDYWFICDALQDARGGAAAAD